MRLHVTDSIFWLESRYEERDAAKEAGFLWHGGNCRAGCGACAAGLGKVWWTRRRESAIRLGEHAVDEARRALGIEGAGASSEKERARAAEKEASAEKGAAAEKGASAARAADITDGNLRLAMVASLMREKILPRLDLERLRRETPPDIDDEEDDAEYVYNHNLAERLAKTRITTAHLARLRALSWPDAEYDLVPLLFPQWDGEDEEFDIKRLKGVEHCTGLERLELAHCHAADLTPLAGLGALRHLDLDGQVGVTTLRPLAGLQQLEVLSLRGIRVTDLGPLASLPRLKSVALDWDWDVRGARDLKQRSGALVDELRARKVKLKIEWPRGSEPEPEPKRKEKAKAAPSFTPASDPAQEEHLRAHPGDDEAMLVYGDWLQAHGDPRGVLAGLDHRLAEGKDPTVARARRAHLQAYGDYLLGRFVDFPFKDVAKMTWRSGFIRAAEMPCVNTGVDSGDVLRELLALPAARFLSELTIDNMFFEDGDGAAPAILGAASPAPPLRVLRLRPGAFSGGDDPAPAELGNVAALWRRYPRLRELFLAGEAKLGEIYLPEAVDVTLVSFDLPRAAVSSIARADWPALERLRLDFGLAERMSLKVFEPLLGAARCPRLRHLTLRAVPAGDALAAALPESPLLRRLETLDLSGTDMSGEGIAAMIGAAPAFAHLQHLNLRGCDVGAADKRALKKLCAKVTI